MSEAFLHAWGGWDYPPPERKGSAMKKQPVLILLSGLAVVVNLFLVMCNALGWTHLDSGQLAAIIGFVTGACALTAAVLRAWVWPEASVERIREETLAELEGAVRNHPANPGR